ncbi:hypothetical protein ENSA5_45660 [Enhygromyxa salina]|uniref:Lipoprotein n=1 Tax=Enhygromyxa salina TaxID=215803 RepID=A0A2S9XJN0_9BACT|nr:hypothetical protein ENSA5_45660 [Enhygromyxa salina]
MSRYHRPIKAHPILILAVLLGACADEQELDPICEWVVDKNECGGVNAGETGAGEEDEQGEEGYPCTLAADGQTRTVYQCEGNFSASISFTTLLGDCAQTLGDPEKCDETHDFGPHDEPYEMPAVMACCDPEDPPNLDLLVKYCASDMVEQVCRSIPMRIQYMIDSGDFFVGENQAQKLQNWLAGHQQDCFNALYKLTDVPGKLTPVSWTINNGKNGDWPGLNGFVITLGSAQVDSASLPESEDDYLSCHDNDFNNTEFFEEAVPISPGINSVTHLVESSPASVMGPELHGGQVFGVGSFASQATDCAAPWCSQLEITEGEPYGGWTLEELELYGDGPASLTNGIAVLPVERVAIRLYQVGLGAIQSDRSGAPVYAIQAGEAHFVLSGVGAGAVYDLRWGTNASAITARKDGSGWVIDSFVIEHFDAKGERWTVTVPHTSWL